MVIFVFDICMLSMEETKTVVAFNHAAAGDGEHYLRLVYNAPTLTVHEDTLSPTRSLKNGDVETSIAFHPTAITKTIFREQNESSTKNGACTGFWCGAEKWPPKCDEAYHTILTYHLVGLALVVSLLVTLAVADIFNDERVDSYTVNGVCTWALIPLSIALFSITLTQLLHDTLLYNENECFIKYVLALPNNAYTQEGSQKTTAERVFIQGNIGLSSVLMLLFISYVVYEWWKDTNVKVAPVLEAEEPLIL